MTWKNLFPITLLGFLAGVLLAARPLDAQQVAGPAQQVARGGTAALSSSSAPAAAGNGLPQAPAPSMQPSWIPLPPAHEQYVDQVLQYWEYKSSQVKRYRCAFRRWEYDPVFGPQDTFKTYSEGQVMYSAPDKGLFRVEKLQQYQAPKQNGGKPTFEDAPADMFEHWVCDGHWVWQFDHTQKRLVQTELPPEMRGQSIGNGPLPFLFNAKAEDIKRRFWIHAITPKGKKEYWLEAVPRTQQDAANFKMIHVIIDETDFLPKAMVLFEQGNAASRTTYEFASREVNFSILAEQLNIFHREFYEPAPPAGWKKEVRKWNQSVAPPEGAASTAQTATEADPRR